MLSHPCVPASVFLVSTDGSRSLSHRICVMWDYTTR